MAKVGRASRNASLLRVETVTGDKTLAAAESGEVYFLDGSAELNFTVTLPSAKAGAYFTFVLSAASHANTQILIDAGTGSTIQGTTIVQAAGGADTKAAHSNQKLGFADASIVGSIVEIVCDGTNWFLLRAESSAAFVTAF